MTFDAETDLLWIGDVGQSYRDEINVISTKTGGGTNFGWATMEGTACFRPRQDCNKTGMTLPIEDYPPRSGHCSVIAGPVYRGDDIPTLTGNYLYSDHCKGELRVMNPQNPRNRQHRRQTHSPRRHPIRPTRHNILRHVDTQNEIYILRFNGPILKMVPR